jgi:S-methylmethionine-dependent homocysteine/selenocysteine methylase
MNWRNALASGHRLVLDGGTGSELRRRGVTLSDICWSAAANVEHADLLEAIHGDYIRAGADIVTANTFATTRFVLAGAGLEGRFQEINASALGTARRTAFRSSRDVAVAASLSCLPPGFDRHAYPDSDAEYAAYCELADRFADCRVDLVLLEMMQDTKHTVRACRAVRSAGLPFWIGISCRLGQKSRDGGQDLVAFDDPDCAFDAVLEALLPFDPEGFSIMHSPLDAIVPALERLRVSWAGAIGAYAEIPYADDPEQTTVHSTSPSDYARAAREWLDAGCVLVGGCCGTTPAHIEAVRREVDR